MQPACPNPSRLLRALPSSLPAYLPVCLGLQHPVISLPPYSHPMNQALSSSTRFADGETEAQRGEVVPRGSRSSSVYANSESTKKTSRQKDPASRLPSRAAGSHRRCQGKGGRGRIRALESGFKRPSRTFLTGNKRRARADSVRRTPPIQRERQREGGRRGAPDPPTPTRREADGRRRTPAKPRRAPLGAAEASARQQLRPQRHVLPAGLGDPALSPHLGAPRGRALSPGPAPGAPPRRDAGRGARERAGWTGRLAGLGGSPGGWLAAKPALTRPEAPPPPREASPRPARPRALAGSPAPRIQGARAWDPRRPDSGDGGVDGPRN